MKLLLLGKNGQLGRALAKALRDKCELVAFGRQEADLAAPESLRPLIRTHRPNVIVNAAAYTAVDRAESEPDLALTINGDAPRVLAEEARDCGALFIHYSTDFVFDGNSATPYRESDETNPLSVYGRSKLAGEQAIQESGGKYFIFRTGWVYSLASDNFLTKVLKWSRTQREMLVVNDQVGCPTPVSLLANVTAQIIARARDDRRGLYHLTARGNVSRFDWARAILALDPHAQEQVVARIVPVPSSHFATPAMRPLYSALDCSLIQRTFDLALPAWDEALRTVLTD